MLKNTAAQLDKVKGTIVVREVPFPEPTPDQFVIQVESAALNPLDWKQRETGIFVYSWPFTPGHDVSGTITKVGSNITTFKVGERVASFLLPGGGYQQYTLSSTQFSFLIPTNITFNQASSLPAAMILASEGLFGQLKLERPSLEGATAKKDKTILVWGGSSAIGLTAVRLATNAGYRVFATSSEKNFDLVKSFGAEQVFDYKDEEVVVKIQESGRVEAVYDAVAYEETIKKSAQVLALYGGQVIGTRAHDNLELPENVKYGVGFGRNAFIQNDGEIAKWAYNYVTKALENGLMVPLPIKIMDGGLNRVQDLLDYGQNGQVSGQKVIINPQ